MSPRINIEITSDRNCARSRSDVVTLPSSKVAGSCRPAIPNPTLKIYRGGGGGTITIIRLFSLLLTEFSRLAPSLVAPTISIQEFKEAAKG